MSATWVRLLLAAMVALSCTGPALAVVPDIAEIVRIHIAALGGQERLDELKAFKATGTVATGGQRLPFTVIAARPNRLRMQYIYPSGELVQAYDGVHPPWERDARVQPAKVRQMGRAAAEAFMAGATFDDALLVANQRGDTIEFAGTTTVDERAMVRLLVTQRLSKAFFLLLDAETYLIVSRIDPKPAGSKNARETITEYRNYWPVAGVLAAHAVTVWTDGEVSEQAVLETTEANPALPRDIFTQPPSP